MTYLLLALGLLREIASREPQCFAAVVAGVLGLLFTTRLRLAGAAHTLARRSAMDTADQRVTASVR